MKVYLNLNPNTAPADNGIGQIVRAQWRYLPEYDIQLVDIPDVADLIACHVQQTIPGLQIDALHCHGLYFEDVPHAPYTSWHVRVNREIAASVRKARFVTVPSDWVAQPFRRDLRIAPWIITHGINLEEWEPGDNKGYVLWNKGRNLDVCDPTPAWNLARAGNLVVSTFAPPGKTDIPSTFKVVGLQSFDRMKQLIKSAGVYLATTLETFGIGTVEALACGVPVLGYAWGGTADIIKHGYNGFLVNPGGDLREGLAYIRDHRDELSKNARISSLVYDWKEVIQQYVHLYRTIHMMPREAGWSIVITNHNYETWVTEAIESAIEQRNQFKNLNFQDEIEIIVVDDGSTDNSREAIGRYGAHVRTIFTENRGVAAARNTGIRAAQGDFITCLDADDRLAPNFGRELLPAIKADNGLGVVYGTIALMNDNGGDLRATNWPGDFSWEVQTELRNPPATNIPTPSACIFRKAMWARSNGYRQEFAPGEDTEFMTRSLGMGWDARRATSEVVTYYRLHGESASKTKKYRTIEASMPWLEDKIFPFASPTRATPRVFSYMLPLVSVIIPVGSYHTAQVLKAIESVIGQTFRNWELILVFDIPETEDYIRNWRKISEWYPFANIITTWGMKKPIASGIGAGAARNIGIQAAKAPLVVFLDADDTLAPTALSELLDIYSKTGFYAYCDSAVVEGGSIVTLPAMEYNQNEWQNQHSITALIEKRIAKEIGFDEELKSWEDWDFFLKMQIKGYCGIRIPRPLLFYNAETGNRRKLAVMGGETTEVGREILETLKERYGDYFNGVKKMSSCCGGSADVIMAAKRAMNPGAYDTNYSPAVEGAVVRMEFTGEEVGGITYPGNNGRSYRAGNNPVHKYLDVHPDDVNKLLANGNFKVLAMPAPQPVPQPAQQIPADVPTLQAKAAQRDPRPAGIFEFLDGDEEIITSAREELPKPQNLEIIPPENPGDTPIMDFLNPPAEEDTQPMKFDEVEDSPIQSEPKKTEEVKTALKRPYKKKASPDA